MSAFLNVSEDETEDHDGSASTRTYTQSNRRYCPHCNQFVVLKTYRSHKRLYFSKVSLPVYLELNLKEIMLILFVQEDGWQAITTTTPSNSGSESSSPC